MERPFKTKVEICILGVIKHFLVLDLTQFRGNWMESPQYFANTKSSLFIKKELGHKYFQLPSSLCIPFGPLWRV